MKGTLIIGVISSVILLAAIMQPATIEARPSSTLRRTLKAGPFTRTACDYDELKISCTYGRIEIDYAKYGGWSGNSCKSTENPGAKPCKSNAWKDVTDGIADRCDDEKSCELLVVCDCGPHNGDFGDVDNCPNKVKMGEVSWYCT